MMYYPLWFTRALMLIQDIWQNLPEKDFSSLYLLLNFCSLFRLTARAFLWVCSSRSIQFSELDPAISGILFWSLSVHLSFILCVCLSVCVFVCLPICLTSQRSGLPPGLKHFRWLLLLLFCMNEGLISLVLDRCVCLLASVLFSKKVYCIPPFSSKIDGSFVHYRERVALSVLDKPVCLLWIDSSVCLSFCLSAQQRNLSS